MESKEELVEGFKRISFVASTSTQQKLEELVVKRKSDYSTVIQEALKTFYYLLEERRMGYDIEVVKLVEPRRTLIL